jgi:uncharacterized protein YndB with AHSA1/START domain
MNKRTSKWASTIFAGLTLFTALSPAATSQAATEKSVVQVNQIAKDLVVIRTFDAPVQEVWKYWAESEQVRKWWGPTGFTSPLAKMDFREGGTSLVCMRAPNGQEFYNTWTYRKIVPLKEIEYVLDWADKESKKTDPTAFGLPANMPREVRHVITFKTLDGGKTEMTVTEYGYTSEQHYNLSKMGLEQCLNKMAAALTGK